MDDLANLELRVACIEEWIVQTTNLLSDSLAPAQAEDLQKITMQLMGPALNAKKQAEQHEAPP